MFSGNWKESNEPRIEFDIPDLNITTKGISICIFSSLHTDCYMPSLSHVALDIAFSSLYRDEVPLEEVHMCSTIAAGSMLQMVSTTVEPPYPGPCLPCTRV